MNQYEKYRAEHAQISAQIKELEAQDEIDTETVDALYARAAELTPLAEAELAKAEQLAKAGEVFARANKIDKSFNFNKLSDNDVDFNTVAKQAFNRFRASQSDTDAYRFRATVESETSSGSLREHIVGDIIRFVDAKRYTIDSLSLTSLPPGHEFKVVVETPGSSTVDAQGSEGGTLASNYNTLTTETVEHETYGGYINLTLQALYFPVPNAEELWARKAAEDYAAKTNAVVAAALKTAANSGEVVGLSNSGATGATISNAIFAAVDQVYSDSKTAADTIWVSPDVRRWLGSIHTSAGEPYFPMLNPQNRNGSLGGYGQFDGMYLGDLKLVVEPNFATSTFIVGASKWGRVWESMYPELVAWAPSTLTKQIAIAGELGYRFEEEGFVRIIDTDNNSGATPNF